MTGRQSGDVFACASHEAALLVPRYLRRSLVVLTLSLFDP